VRAALKAALFLSSLGRVEFLGGLGIHAAGMAGMDRILWLGQSAGSWLNYFWLERMRRGALDCFKNFFSFRPAKRS